MTAVFAALTRNDIADYVSALITVYTLLIFAYILTSLIFSFGVRVPYARWSDAILSFLRDVCEPYLRIFRRFIPLHRAARPQPDRGDRRAADRRQHHRQRDPRLGRRGAAPGRRAAGVDRCVVVALDQLTKAW